MYCVKGKKMYKVKKKLNFCMAPNVHNDCFARYKDGVGMEGMGA